MDEQVREAAKAIRQGMTLDIAITSRIMDIRVQDQQRQQQQGQQPPPAPAQLQVTRMIIRRRHIYDTVVDNSPLMSLDNTRTTHILLSQLGQAR